jgi:hypothetical protein
MLVACTTGNHNVMDANAQKTSVQDTSVQECSAEPFHIGEAVLWAGFVPRSS